MPSPFRHIFAWFPGLVAAAAFDAAAAKDVLPAVLEARCFDCHGEEAQKSGLRLDSLVAVLRGGGSGEKTVVPGKNAESYLIELVTSSDEKHRMPPKGKPLTAAEIDSLRLWIDNAGAWTAAIAEVSKMSTRHWSYQPMMKPEVPAAVFANPIDAFIEAKLRETGLAFNPPADARTLLAECISTSPGWCRERQRQGNSFRTRRLRVPTRRMSMPRSPRWPIRCSTARTTASAGHGIGSMWAVCGLQWLRDKSRAPHGLSLSGLFDPRVQ